MKNNLFPRPLVLNSVSGYSVNLSAETDHSREMAKIYAETSRAVARYDVQTPKGQKFSVELYYSTDRNALPHGYSLDGRDDYSGLLGWDGESLADFDGLSFLPRSVCAVLRAHGLEVSDDFLASPL